MKQPFIAGVTVAAYLPATTAQGHTLSTSASWTGLLNVDDTFWMGYDELTVRSRTDSTVVVDGLVSLAYASQVAYRDANVYERGLVFKTASAGLTTLRVVPDLNWRGTGARLQIKRPRGAPDPEI